MLAFAGHWLAMLLGHPLVLAVQGAWWRVLLITILHHRQQVRVRKFVSVEFDFPSVDLLHGGSFKSILIEIYSLSSYLFW